MISVTDLRNGTIFTEGDNLLQVLNYEHIKLGRGSATIKIKMRNMRTGAVTERSFINGARVVEVYLEKKEAQYLYKQKDTYVFMDTTTYEQFEIPKKVLGEGGVFLQEGMNIPILFWNSEALSMDLPIKMEFTVAETPPGVRGNTVSNLYKEATLSNGYVTKVPLFINEGDKVRIDTRTGEYVERVSK